MGFSCSPFLSDSGLHGLCVCVCVHIYICVCTHIYNFLMSILLKWNMPAEK